MNVPSGNATSMFLRLFARAPRTTSSPRVGGRRAAGTSNRPRAAQVLPGQRLARRRTAAAAAGPGTSRGRRARRRPARGRRDSRPCGSSPRRARRRARCCRDCAACRASPSSRRLSRWCRPIDGSSSTYSTPVSCEPICVASRMRCPSPPESVAAPRAEREVADADVGEKPQPLADLAQHAAGDEVLALGQLERLEQRQRPRTIGRLTYSASRRPFTRTARLSGRSRSPSQAGHGCSARYGSSAS